MAVVRDDIARRVRAPKGVTVVEATRYLKGLEGRCDLDVYQMGNHPWFHGYMHEAALLTPGLLVLHDVALLDFYAVVVGGMDSPVLFEEARLEDPTIVDGFPSVELDGRTEPDRLAVPLARRLVGASLMTIVHSAALRDVLLERYPTALVRHVNQPARILESPHDTQGAANREVVFGIFGSLERHKRVVAAVRAFARIHALFPGRARLVIAGRLDNPTVEKEVRKIIRTAGIAAAVRILTDLPLEQLEAQIAAKRCRHLPSLADRRRSQRFFDARAGRR